MSGIPVFMVELANEREVTDQVRSWCHVAGCRRKHVDEDGRRRHAIAQPWTDTRYDVVRVDTGELVAEAVWSLSMCRIPGAMFWWKVQDKAADERQRGAHQFASGPQLTVILPGGHPWNIDGRASNCTLPEDFEHRCWVRHGEPPAITVDKDGLTCAAGAGSIQVDGWHGFLRNGELVA